MTSECVRGWLKIRGCSGVGDITLRRLMESFDSPQAVLAASHSDLLAVQGLRQDVIDRIPQCMDDRVTDQEFDQALTFGCSLVTVCDSNYPERLKAIYDAPPVLYTLGTLEETDRYSVAIVGARRSTSYGRAMTEQLSAGLAKKAFTIVSGMARGTDGWAHRAALDAGGRTVAVLGCGVDVTYPLEHNRLKQDILSHGVVMSEFPLGAPPDSVHFPKRNRIISGLTLGTVVVEATAHSGSLITARLALEQGREVFAVPGNVGNDSSEGTNHLIQQGAKLVGRIEDIIEELLPQLDEVFVAGLRQPEMESSGSKSANFAELSGEVMILYQLLDAEPMHIDALVQGSGLHVSTVSGRLLEMELSGLVEQLTGQWYRRVR